MLDHLKTLLAEGRYAAAKKTAQGLLLDNSLASDVKGEVAIMGVQASLMLHEGYLADKLARTALECAQESGNDDLEGRATFFAGTIKAAIGDNAEAKVLFAQFIRGLSDRWPHLDAEYTVHVFNNLGQVCWHQRLYPDALANYTRALHRFVAANDTRGQVMVHHQMAWVLTITGAYAEAQQHLNLALALGQMPPDLSTHQLTHEGLLLLYQGSHGAAMERATEVLTPNRPEVSPASKAVACYITAKVALAQGNTTMALQFVECGYAAAMDSGLAHVMNLINDVRNELNRSTAAGLKQGGFGNA